MEFDSESSPRFRRTVNVVIEQQDTEDDLPVPGGIANVRWNML